MDNEPNAEKDINTGVNRLPMTTCESVLTDLGALIGQYESMQRSQMQKYDDKHVVPRLVTALDTYRLTALIPGFYDAEIQAVNQEKEPQFPEMGSQEMLARLKLAQDKLREAVTSGVPISCQPHELTKAGSEWLKRKTASFIREKAEFDRRNKMAEDRYPADVGGHAHGTSYEEHARLDRQHERLSREGFQLSVIAPGFYRDDQQDTSFRARGGKPLVPQVASRTFMSRITQYAE